MTYLCQRRANRPEVTLQFVKDHNNLNIKVAGKNNAGNQKLA